jgi:drug/metabolite transporter (DMT)-like permease
MTSVRAALHRALPSRIVSPMNAPSPRDNRSAALLMVGAVFGFATMSALAHGLRADLPWPVVAFARSFVMLFVAAVLLWWTGAPLVLRGNAALWVRSLFGSMGVLLTFYAVSRLPVTDTIVLFATSPIWITLILALLGEAKPAPYAWLHILLAVGGVWVMYRPAFDAAALPLLLALAGAVAVAIAMVGLSLSRDYPHVTIVAHFSAVASLVTLAVSLPVFDAGTAAALVVPRNLGALLALGAAGTASQLLMTAAYRRGNATLVALVGLTQIVFAAIYDIVLFGHTPDAWKALGVALIALGIVLNVVQGHRPNPEPA